MELTFMNTLANAGKIEVEKSSNSNTKLHSTGKKKSKSKGV